VNRIENPRYTKSRRAQRLGPKSLSRVTLVEIRGGAKDPLALVGVSRLGGAWCYALESMKSRNATHPWWDKPVVTGSGHTGRSSCSVLFHAGRSSEGPVDLLKVPAGNY
jgi:hypothetical protein